MNTLTRALVCIPVLLSLGCSEVLGPEQPRPGYNAVELDATVANAYTAFGFDLYRELVAETPGENLLVSPASAAFALAMTYNGASGATREAMAKTLGVAGIPIDRVNAANGVWLAALRDTQDPKVELALANSIWAREGFPFREAFYARNRDFYDAEVRALPFDDAALNTINGWAEEQTRGKIDKVLDEITPDQVMFLINALYFKGQWRYRFDEQETRPGTFTRFDGSRIQVPMMNQRAELPYLRGDDFQMVALPYGNDRFSMVLALPDPGLSLEGFYARATPDRWADWTAEMQHTEVGIILPRFTMESDRRLNDPLTELGMGIAFDQNRADFSEMSAAGRLFIDFVRQKTFVEVNEEGTEAAAVTVVGIGRVCACGPTSPVLQFDRPFFFAIQDNATGTLLFLGQMMDPSAG